MAERGRGHLIAVEGTDGAGTTTQCRLLGDWLGALGHEVHLTREPSTGPVGALLRELLAGRHAPVDPGAVALLFAADRLDHLAREIAPALGRGAVVLTDRYLLSSLVYQSLTVPREFVAAANARAPRPDLTLYVDVPPEVAAVRRQRRGGAEELFDADATQRRVIEAYRREAEAARAAGDAIAIVDGTPAPEAVLDALRRALCETCPALARPPSSP